MTKRKHRTDIDYAFDSGHRRPRQPEKPGTTDMSTAVKNLLEKNAQLNHLEAVKVDSHVQREIDNGEWISHSLMLEAYDVPFKYRRKKRYRSLQGARVNLTYYPVIETVAGFEMEVMKVVRIRRS